MKKALTAALAVVFSYLLTFSGFADKTTDKVSYTALGDSITTGYGLYDNNDCFAKKLSTDFGFELEILAQDGATSSDLLASLSDEEFTQSVRNTDIITLSIGGNDVLSILTEIFFKALMETDINIDGGVSELIEAAEGALKIISAKIASEENLTRLYTAVHNFERNYDDIMIKLKSENPNAKLYVQTLYNPFGGIPAFEEFNELAETIISGINAPIYGNAEKYAYTVIDTYRSFKGRTLTRTNIISLDVHPSKSGHNAIYEMLKEAVTLDGFFL